MANVSPMIEGARVEVRRWNSDVWEPGLLLWMVPFGWAVEVSAGGRGHFDNDHIRIDPTEVAA